LLFGTRDKSKAMPVYLIHFLLDIEEPDNMDILLLHIYLQKLR